MIPQGSHGIQNGSSATRDGNTIGRTSSCKATSTKRTIPCLFGTHQIRAFVKQSKMFEIDIRTGSREGGKVSKRNRANERILRKWSQWACASPIYRQDQSNFIISEFLPSGTNPHLKTFSWVLHACFLGLERYHILASPK